MARFFGFEGHLNTGAGSDDCLPGILKKLPAGDRKDTYRHLQSNPPGKAAVCVNGTGSVYSDNDLLVSISGQPTWSDSSLQSVAKDKSHAEAAAMAHRRYGTAMLDYLHGSFALAVLEPGKGKTLIAIDRLGIQPMVYTVADGLIVFGSDLDSVMAHPAISRDLDPQGLFHYLYFHMVPAPGSICQNVRKLLPGEYLVSTRGKTNRSFYWHLEYQETRVSEADLADELLSLLEKSVLENRPSEPTGAFLSGGLDSSTVTGMLARVSGTTADAYSIGFHADGYDEMEFARASAKHFNVNLHEYYVTPSDVLDAIPRIAAAYDEPFGNASAIPAYYCARFAKEDGMACLLAGDGGDEIFAGNARYAKQKLFGLYQHFPALFREHLVEPLFLGNRITGQTPLLRKIRSYIEQARLPMPDRMESYNFLHRSPLSEIFDPDFLALVDPAGPLDNLGDVYSRADTDSMLKQMLHMDLKITLADNDLRKVNRMCELAGIEVRYPMLDERLVEFSARIPSNMLMRRTELRSFYRHAMKDFLAPETLDKNKQGFGLPFGVWMSEDRALSELAYDSISAFRKRGYLNQRYTDRLLEEHRTGHAGYYGVMIWVIMMLEQWLSAHS
jgi:asparagine synthase (glutamine-hydrolysing)